jgi:uncharacterized membrane protein
LYCAGSGFFVSVKFLIFENLEKAVSAQFTKSLYSVGADAGLLVAAPLDPVDAAAAVFVDVADFVTVASVVGVVELADSVEPNDMEEVMGTGVGSVNAGGELMAVSAVGASVVVVSASVEVFVADLVVGLAVDDVVDSDASKISICAPLANPFFSLYPGATRNSSGVSVLSPSA